MITKEQIQWCIKNQIVIRFIYVYTHSRVVVECGGHPHMVERDTLEEAIEDGIKLLAKRRKAYP
jgi:hypothetical protein